MSDPDVRVEVLDLEALGPDPRLSFQSDVRASKASFAPSEDGNDIEDSGAPLVVEFEGDDGPGAQEISSSRAGSLARESLQFIISNLASELVGKAMKSRKSSLATVVQHDDGIRVTDVVPASPIQELSWEAAEDHVRDSIKVGLILRAADSITTNSIILPEPILRTTKAFTMTLSSSISRHFS